MRNEYKLIAIVSIIVLSIYLFQQLSTLGQVDEHFALRSSLITYKNEEIGITFRYPPEWSIQEESDNVIAVIPPWFSQRYSYGGYEETPGPEMPFGIRVSPPLNTLGGFPADITCERISSRFSDMDNVLLKRLLINRMNKKIVVLYAITSDKTGAVAFVQSGNTAFQVSLGRYSEVANTIDDWVAFLDVLLSLESLPTRSATTMAGLFACDR